MLKTKQNQKQNPLLNVSIARHVNNILLHFFPKPVVKKKKNPQDLLFQKLLLSRNFQTEHLRHGSADTFTAVPQGSPLKV